MRNDGKEDRRTSNEGNGLDRVLRAAASRDPGTYSRPSPEAILAYLEGNATPEQLAQVREALLVSPGFRQEMGELAKGIEYVTGDEAPGDFERIPVSDKAVANIRGAKEQKGSFASTMADSLRRSAGKLLDAMKPPVWRLATAGVGVAVIALVVLNRLGVGVNQNEIMYASAQPGISYHASILQLTRGDSNDNGSVLESGAALAAFNECVQWTGDSTLVDRDCKSGRPKPEPARSVGLVLADASNGPLREIEFSVPANADSIALWTLTFGLDKARIEGAPARDSLCISHQPLTRDRIRLVLDAQAREAFYTVTYKLENRFFAVPAVYSIL